MELLRPFSDAIRHLKGDEPNLAECHHALVAPRKHVDGWTKKHKEAWLDDDACPVAGWTLATMDRRLDAAPGGSVAPVYNTSYSAAFAVDPFFADGETTCLVQPGVRLC